MHNYAGIGQGSEVRDPGCGFAVSGCICIIIPPNVLSDFCHTPQFWRFELFRGVASWRSVQQFVCVQTCPNQPNEMKHNRLNEGRSNRLSKCCSLTNCQNLTVTHVPHLEFNLCPLLEVILYSLQSFTSTYFVYCLE